MCVVLNNGLKITENWSNNMLYRFIERLDAIFEFAHASAMCKTNEQDE